MSTVKPGRLYIKHKLFHFGLVGLWLLRFSCLWSSLRWAPASHQGHRRKHTTFFCSPLSYPLCIVWLNSTLSLGETCSWCAQGVQHGTTVLPRKLKPVWEQQWLDLDWGKWGLPSCMRWSHCGTATYFYVVFLVLSWTSPALLLMLTFSLPNETSICSTFWKGSGEQYPDTCCQKRSLFPLP